MPFFGATFCSLQMRSLLHPYDERMPVVDSVNVGAAKAIRAKSGLSGIDKIPTNDPVAVSSPGPTGSGAGGLAGDVICDTENHGGDDQAVYAYAREDLDWWQSTLSQPLRSGMFGENLTTIGLDITGARIGERWRIGSEVELQVTGPRIPCSTFAAWMNRKGWLKAFTRHATPGAYLRVVTPGEVRAGDLVEVAFSPEHDVTVGKVFRALTYERELLPSLLGAREFLVPETIRIASGAETFDFSDDV
jgi:MOSC domain-containing protein YiiM